MAQKPKQLVTLKDHLDAWYMSTVRDSGGNPITVVDHFKNLAGENTNLMVEAREMLESIQGVGDERCFITKTYKSFLNKVLN